MLLGTLIRNAKDAYHVKREIAITAVIWVMVVVISLSWNYVSTPHLQYYFPSVLLLLIGQVGVDTVT